jgi:hypothetical protein
MAFLIYFISDYAQISLLILVFQSGPEIARKDISRQTLN